MFAVIGSYRPTGDISKPGFAEPYIISVHDSFEEAQAGWVAVDEELSFTRWAPTYMGILGPTGLLNYKGERMTYDNQGKSVEIRMGIF